jgi:HD domain
MPQHTMSNVPRLRPYTPDPAALHQPLAFDVYTDRGVLWSRMGSTLPAGKRQFANRQLFREAGQEDDGDCPALEALLEQGRGYERSAGAWGCQAADACRIDGVAQELILSARSNPALCSGMAMHMPIQSHAMAHSFAVAATAVSLGIWLDLDDKTLATLARAALTMNIASLALHDDCATWRGPLEPEKRQDIGGHPQLAANLLTQTPGIDLRWIDTVEQHHENTDGSGYPYGNRRDDIPLEARILRVADVWCAQISPGADRIGAPPKAIIDRLFQQERRRLDDRVLFELRRRFGAYPPGSLVRLMNRETALVTTWANGGAPKYVVSILTPSGEIAARPKVRLTARPAHAIRNYAPFSPNQLRAIPWRQAWAAAA